MIHIGRANNLVVIQISDDTGAVTGQSALSVETANVVTNRIAEIVKEIGGAKHSAPEVVKPKKKWTLGQWFGLGRERVAS